jgi:hypothetical protein
LQYANDLEYVLHVRFNGFFFNIDRNLPALFNQIKTNLLNVREYRKANQKFEINFVKHELFLKIQTVYKQTDEAFRRIPIACSTMRVLLAFPKNINT